MDLAKERLLIVYGKPRYISDYYINADEIPGFLLLLKNHIFAARSEDTTQVQYSFPKLYSRAHKQYLELIPINVFPYFALSIGSLF